MKEIAQKMKRRHTQPEIEEHHTNRLMLHSSQHHRKSIEEERPCHMERRVSPVGITGMCPAISRAQSLATRRKSTPALMLRDKGVDPESSLLKSLQKLAIGMSLTVKAALYLSLRIHSRLRSPS